MSEEAVSGFVVAVFVPAGSAERFIPSLRSLERHVGAPVVAGGPDAGDLPETLAAERLPDMSAAEVVSHAWERHRTHVLFVSDPVLVPPRLLASAEGILAADIRAGTVSFLSNTAGYLSFPDPSRPTRRPLEGHDEVSVTRALRSLPPTGGPVPVPVAAGACTLLSAGALSAVGTPAVPPGGLPADLARDFSLEAAKRGFVPYLDPSTYYSRPTDLSGEPGHALDSAAALGAGAAGRHPYAVALVEEASAPDSPLSLAIACARAKVLGLRILIDGTCLGPNEMGTQVATLALVRALAARDDVSEVQLTAPRGIPAYAATIASDPKVRVVAAAEAEADVMHRPYQPDPHFSPEAWRRSAGRVVVTVLDLIAYEIGSYHDGAGDWLKYRRIVQRVLRSVDAVTTISQDVRRHIELEGLAVEPSRLRAVPIGTDHLTGDEPGRRPRELSARGFDAEAFVLTLGANFTHKNRDLAVQAHALLRARHPGLALVLAGAHVPYGSSLVAEARVPSADEVFDLPDTTSEERNWLLRNASAVLYPTSAEGFGLVPFEAARFGTPTVHVGFGPLRELVGSPPVTSSDWDPRSLAAAVDSLLSDPELARAQVAAVLAAGEKHEWARTAEELTCLYREVLQRPAVSGGAVPAESGAPDDAERLRREIDDLRRERLRVEEELARIRSTKAFRAASRLWALRQAMRSHRAQG